MKQCTQRLRVGLYVNDAHATIERFVRCFKEWNFDFVSIRPDELTGIRSLGVHVLLLHGGWYGIDRHPGQDQYRNIETTPELKRRGDAVRGWVRSGGGVVGVCAGSYNVVWLGLVEADISRMDGVGVHSLEVRDEHHPLCRGVIERTQGRKDRLWKRVPVIRMSGPMFFPKKKATMVFSYDWEGRLGAILAAGYGKGRAVACSPHPERTESDFADAVELAPLMPVARVLRNSLVWAAGREVE